MITLTDARPGDEVAIVALCTELDEFYSSLPEGLPAERAAQVQDVLFGDPPLACALVAWDGGAPAGFAAYSFLWPAVGLTASLYLKELYVAEAYRRTGVGRLLMNGLYDVARRRGLSRVEWTTDTSNVGAQAFYESLGARPLASKIFYRAVS
jgi:GNAT superfamily N-acetyltransferase